MEVLLNHVTRMAAGRVCVAGIDLQSGKHVRLVEPGKAFLPRWVLAEEGGPARARAVVRVEPADAAVSPPHLEDRVVDPASITLIGHLPWPTYLGILERHADERIEDVLGKELTSAGATAVRMPEGCGVASLAVFPAKSRSLTLSLGKDATKVRLRIPLLGSDRVLTVTDASLHESDGTPKADLVEKLSNILWDDQPCFVMLGLTRLWAPEGSPYPPCHWLQVNGLAPRSGLPDQIDADRTG